MPNPDLELQIKALRKAVLNIGKVVDGLAVQWSSTAYQTGEPELGVDPDPDPTPDLPTVNELALERRRYMLTAKEALEQVPE